MAGVIEKLAGAIRLGRAHQDAAVRWALERLINGGRTGVILADEVGCGKTYEALAIAALLWRWKPRTSRILILAPTNLLRKWDDELQTKESDRHGGKHGFPAYLQGKEWDKFKRRFLSRAGYYYLDRVSAVNDMWRDYRLVGERRRGRIQTPPGLYLVNNRLLYDTRSCDLKPLKYIMRTDWDLVIVDEAHHYGRGNHCDGIFANRYRHIGRDVPDFGADGTLRYKKLLLLTATPFELQPDEMINLFRLIRVPNEELELLEESLTAYQRLLGQFHELRELPASNERRANVVKALERKRLGTSTEPGLEKLLRGSIVRNRKDNVEREYSLVVRRGDTWGKEPFDKFDDLRRCCRELPLIPFSGTDAIFYLEFRRLLMLLQEEHRGKGNGRGGIFTAMDLQQGLSSYPQLLAKREGVQANRLMGSNHPAARRIRRMLQGWVRAGRLHPKAAAVREVITQLLTHELERAMASPKANIAKTVVFSKLVAGTAPHLRKVIEFSLQPVLNDCLEQLTKKKGLRSGLEAKKIAERQVCNLMSGARRNLGPEKDWGREGRMISGRVLKLAGFKGWTKARTDIATVFEPYLKHRAGQAIFLINSLRRSKSKNGVDILRETVRTDIVDQFTRAAGAILARHHKAAANAIEKKKKLNRDFARELSGLREEWRSPRLVARYDGDVPLERESNRRNFNNEWNPLVLLVSSVGEEGIDLQRQARYIIHYDLEWNPARMEQREGRVDREGYGHKGRSIDVRFLLLKGTYEERIFQTVMARDQWFQILMGAKRRKLGKVGDTQEADQKIERDLAVEVAAAAETETGSLTPAEREAVILNLRPN